MFRNLFLVYSVILLELNSFAFGLDYQPPFLTPSGGEIWRAGGNYSASWNQTFPEGIYESEVATTAMFLLRYKNPDDSSDVSDYGNTTLAQDVPLYPPYPNYLNFTLPDDLQFERTYFLILLGSTSDESPQFTILPDPTHPTPVGPAHLPFPTNQGPGPVRFSSSLMPTPTSSKMDREGNSTETALPGSGGGGKNSTMPGRGKGRGKGKGKGKGMKGKGKKGKGKGEENGNSNRVPKIDGMGMGGQGRQSKGTNNDQKQRQNGDENDLYLREILKVL